MSIQHRVLSGATLAVVCLATMAADCRPTGLPHFGCVQRVRTPPTSYIPEDEPHHAWVHTIVEARCDVRPRSHHMRIALDRKLTQSGRWREMISDEFPGIPPKEDTRLYALTFTVCIPGWWRTRIVVTGQDSKGREYRADPPEVRSYVTCE
ncbi:hypothetical protein [Thermoactinospora rubra]|uniref:hypothetical protein n=1 Tax=Thermoactinospora rubra TaxID=1088767 RepID=UPI000A11B3C7|nr:hypothetical protein [Thermoactinospora rubra]